MPFVKVMFVYRYHINHKYFIGIGIQQNITSLSRLTEQTGEFNVYCMYIVSKNHRNISRVESISESLTKDYLNLVLTNVFKRLQVLLFLKSKSSYIFGTRKAMHSKSQKI